MFSIVSTDDLARQVVGVTNATVYHTYDHPFAAGDIPDGGEVDSALRFEVVPLLVVPGIRRDGKGMQDDVRLRVAHIGIRFDLLRQGMQPSDVMRANFALIPLESPGVSIVHMILPDAADLAPDR